MVSAAFPLPKVIEDPSNGDAVVTNPTLHLPPSSSNLNVDVSFFLELSLYYSACSIVSYSTHKGLYCMFIVIICLKCGPNAGYKLVD